jgi:hypothetical protein
MKITQSDGCCKCLQERVVDDEIRAFTSSCYDDTVEGDGARPQKGLEYLFFLFVQL